MIEKINNEHLKRIVEKSVQPPAATGKSEPKAQGDASLQVDFEALLEKAKQVPDDSAAVEDARRLLKTGKLDTPENIRKAAQNILDRGI